MKKLLAIILAAIMMLSMAGCGGGAKDNPDQPSNSGPCTKHSGAEVCSVCGIDYFDELVKHLQEKYNGNAEDKSGDGMNSDWYIRYNSSKNYIECYEKDHYVYLYIYKTDLNECKYDWKTKSNPLYRTEHSGRLDASRISPSYGTINLSEHSHNNTVVPKTFGEGMRGIIYEALIPLIKEVGNNISPANFGFERFE